MTRKKENSENFWKAENCFDRNLKSALKQNLVTCQCFATKYKREEFIYMYILLMYVYVYICMSEVFLSTYRLQNNSTHSSTIYISFKTEHLYVLSSLSSYIYIYIYIYIYTT